MLNNCSPNLVVFAIARGRPLHAEYESILIRWIGFRTARCTEDTSKRSSEVLWDIIATSRPRAVAGTITKQLDYDPVHVVQEKQTLPLSRGAVRDSMGGLSLRVCKRPRAWIAKRAFPPNPATNRQPGSYGPARLCPSHETS